MRGSNREMLRLLGEFEAEKVGVVRRETFTYYDKILREFLEFFPKKKTPQDFSICDVEDYKGHLENSRSFWRVRLELQVIRMFWNWLHLKEKFRELSQIVNSQKIEQEVWALRTKTLHV